MTKVTVYRTIYCPFCDAAERYLDQKGVSFECIDVSDPEDKMALKTRTGWRTVPQIFIDGELIGGYQEMLALDRTGELDQKLA